MGTEIITISGNIVDVVNQKIFKGEIEISNGKISGIREKQLVSDQYILPGLIDAHIHIESSMLVPSEFARLAVIHGTVATVSDPHEIANVMGFDGITFMIENGKMVPFHFYFGAPSCVPATRFETSGATVDPGQISKLLAMDEIRYLSEMMNFPGVIYKDQDVMKKLETAHFFNKPVDGHAPGLRGELLSSYVKAGITTDHECTTMEEAIEKIGLGMKILIREGSAAKDFDTLFRLIDLYPEDIMLCSDDKHPDDLIEGHINLLVKRAFKAGIDPFKVLRACTINPVRHYGLDAGLLRTGDRADFIICDNLTDFNIKSSYISGVKVADKGVSMISSVPVLPVNRFISDHIRTEDIKIVALSERMNVIKAIEGQLYTEKIIAPVKRVNGFAEADPENDLQKLVVLNRYKESSPAIGFIKGFGMKKGAIASTVAHDSHNIIATGTNDDDIVKAINMLIDSRGGISVVAGKQSLILPLPVGGLMSTDNGYKVAELYKSINTKAKEAGTPLKAPFMTLSFMALLVIPRIKLSDRGLFDGEKFEFIPLFI